MRCNRGRRGELTDCVVRSSRAAIRPDKLIFVYPAEHIFVVSYPTASRLPIFPQIESLCGEHSRQQFKSSQRDASIHLIENYADRFTWQSFVQIDYGQWKVLKRFADFVVETVEEIVSSAVGCCLSLQYPT